MSGAARGEQGQRLSWRDDAGARDEAEDLRVDKTVREFQRHVPIEDASTPPSAWYTDAAFADLEMGRVFGRGWQAVGNNSCLCRILPH